jgi:tripartite-type tricarboxylate transporter receptor subunit TctC
MAKVDIVAVPYKGGGSALNDFLGGQVQLMFATPASVMQHIKSGRLRALAITSAEPSALLPGIPPIAASGVPGYRSIASYAVFVPAGTPAALISRLNQEIVLVLNKADVKEKFSNAGIETVGNTPDEVAAMIKHEMASMGKVIRDAGIRAN